MSHKQRGTECAVPLCKSRTGHAFPWSKPDRVKEWSIAIRRDKWQPTKYSVVCRDHFDDNDYIQATTSGKIT